MLESIHLTVWTLAVTITRVVDHRGTHGVINDGCIACIRIFSIGVGPVNLLQSVPFQSLMRSILDHVVVIGCGTIDMVGSGSLVTTGHLACRTGFLLLSQTDCFPLLNDEAKWLLFDNAKGFGRATPNQHNQKGVKGHRQGDCNVITILVTNC